MRRKKSNNKKNKGENILKKAIAVIKFEKNKTVFKEELFEFQMLCSTVDIEIIETLINKRYKSDPAYYIGKGKLNLLKELVDFSEADLVVFNTNLSPVQKRNLENYLKTEILDRTEIILNIFFQHAKTYESKLQVELAQLKYQLPRIIGKGKELSRTGGGIGTRGPGEQEIEYERRRILKRIALIKKKIGEISKERDLMRKEKIESDHPLITLVGYTSAGKSTLLKLLSKDENIAVSKDLFTTLLPKSRRVRLPGGLVAIFSDTVGFIRNLPELLIDSFKSTLEEISYSHLILHVIDASSEIIDEKIKSVEKILKELKVYDIPRLLVFNKIDLIPEEKLNHLKLLYPNSFFISALKNWNVEQLLYKIQEILQDYGILVNYSLKIPYKYFHIVESIRDKISILNEEENAQYIKLNIISTSKIKNILSQYSKEAIL